MLYMMEIRKLKDKDGKIEGIIFELKQIKS